MSRIKLFSIMLVGFVVYTVAWLSCSSGKAKHLVYKTKTNHYIEMPLRVACYKRIQYYTRLYVVEEDKATSFAVDSLAPVVDYTNMKFKRCNYKDGTILATKQQEEDFKPPKSSDD